jgi:hypothetical protein
MGDRANVYIRQSATAGVFLYTHWGGGDLPEVVRVALDSGQGRARWRDDAYLARIVFCQMVGQDGWNDETGFGISAFICDNEHPIIVLDPAGGRIGFAAEPTEAAPLPEPKKWQTFDAYCAQRSAKWPKS